MAKGQQRSNREVRKPKQDKSKPVAATPTSSFTTQMKTAETSGAKKR
jgi:hypothetical protein